MLDNKCLTLDIDSQFHKDVLSLADMIIDSDSFNHRYCRKEDAIDDVMMILLELWLMDESDGMDMLMRYLEEEESALTYMSGRELIGKLAECRPSEYPITSESIDILNEIFEYEDTLPEILPIQSVAFNPTGAFMFVRTMNVFSMRQ